jgi:hypothetical protein
MVVAAAGRRIDAVDTKEPRFPGVCEARVAGAIEHTLEGLGAQVLVSSAACGVDILALEAAGRLGIRRIVVLPFTRNEFRATSVTDRTGNWGARYDEILDDIEDRGDLIAMQLTGRDASVWNGASDRILDESEAIARNLGTSAHALVVWDGRPRISGRDATDYLRRSAINRGFQVTEISTLPTAESAGF